MGGLFSNIASKLGSELDTKVGPALKTASDYLFKSGWEALKSIDAPVTLAGRQVNLGEYTANLLQNERSSGAVISGGIVSNFKDALGKLDPALRQTLPTSGVGHPAWGQTQAYADSLINELAKRGAKVDVGIAKVPIFKPSNDWMPTVFKDAALKPGALREELLDHLVTTNQAINASGQVTRTAAAELVDKIGGMQYGRKGAISMWATPLQIPAKFLETDPLTAFTMWGENVGRFISQHENFGPGDAKLKSLVEAIGNVGGPSAKKLAQNAISAYTYGYSPAAGTRQFYQASTIWEKYVRSFEGLTKLGRVSIAEPSQALNALALTNAQSMAKAIGDVAADRESAVKFALQSGTLIHESIRDFKQIAGINDLTGQMLHYTGFDAIRKMNVILTANAVKHYVTDLADDLVSGRNMKEANAMFKTFGIEPSEILRNGGISQDQIRFAARRGTEIAQFIHNPLDLPMAWSSNPWLRTATLYKTFIFQQGKFTKDIIIKHALDKPANLLYFMTLFPAVGELVRDAETLARGQGQEKRIENSPAAKLPWVKDNPAAIRYLDDMAGIGHIGMFFSLLGAANRNNMAAWLGGPVFGDANDASKALVDLLERGKGSTAGKQLGQRIPVVGPAVTNLVSEK